MDEKQKKMAVVGLCVVAIAVAVVLATRPAKAPELPKETDAKAKKLVEEMLSTAPKQPQETEVPSEKGSGRLPQGGKK